MYIPRLSCICWPTGVKKVQQIMKEKVVYRSCRLLKVMPLTVIQQYIVLHAYIKNLHSDEKNERNKVELIRELQNHTQEPGERLDIMLFFHLSNSLYCTSACAS